MKSKLTEKQREVLEGMRAGYELMSGITSTLLSFGNHSEYIHAGTFKGLVKQHLIEPDAHTRNVWKLTDAGRESIQG